MRQMTHVVTTIASQISQNGHRLIQYDTACHQRPFVRQAACRQAFPNRIFSLNFEPRRMAKQLILRRGTSVLQIEKSTADALDAILEGR